MTLADLQPDDVAIIDEVQKSPNKIVLSTITLDKNSLNDFDQFYTGYFTKLTNPLNEEPLDEWQMVNDFFDDNWCLNCWVWHTIAPIVAYSIFWKISVPVVGSFLWSILYFSVFDDCFVIESAVIFVNPICASYDFTVKHTFIAQCACVGLLFVTDMMSIFINLAKKLKKIK